MDKGPVHARCRVSPSSYPAFLRECNKYIANFNDRCYDSTTKGLAGKERHPDRAAEDDGLYYADYVWVYLLLAPIGPGAILAYQYYAYELVAILFLKEGMRPKTQRSTEIEIEIEKKTAKEAIKIGLAKLGLDKAGADIKVLREENKGLFSMRGVTLAKVRVKKKLQK